MKVELIAKLVLIVVLVVVDDVASALDAYAGGHSILAVDTLFDAICSLPGRGYGTVRDIARRCVDVDDNDGMIEHALVTVPMLWPEGLGDLLLHWEIVEVTKVHIFSSKIRRAFRDIIRDPAGQRRSLAGTVDVVVGVSSGACLIADRVPGRRERVPPPGHGHVLTACGGGRGVGERHY